MGKIKITLTGKTITLDWSEVSDEQLYWVGRSQWYPVQLPNPKNPEEMIDNPTPVVAWVLQKRLQELSDGAYTQYLTETPDPRIANAEALSDFTN